MTDPAAELRTLANTLRLALAETPERARALEDVAGDVEGIYANRQTVSALKAAAKP